MSDAREHAEGVLPRGWETVPPPEGRGRSAEASVTGSASGATGRPRSLRAGDRNISLPLPSAGGTPCRGEAKEMR